MVANAAIMEQITGGPKEKAGLAAVDGRKTGQKA
jgi:hypothetical protein